MVRDQLPSDKNTLIKEGTKTERGTAVSKRQRAKLVRIGVYVATALVLVFVGLTVDWQSIQESFFNPEIFREQFPDIVTQAARNTLIFTFFGFTGGLAVGLVIAVMRISSIRAYRWFAASYIELLRGLPALLTILIIGFGVPIATGTQLPGRYTTGSLALALVASAYIAENIRAGIEAVPRGQMEAARSLGMTYTRAMISIVIPQAFRIIIPPLTNELVLLLKDTSLISVLGVTEATREITRFARDGVIDSANATPFIAAGVVYLAITIPLTRAAALIERRARQAR